MAQGGIRGLMDWTRKRCSSVDVTQDLAGPWPSGWTEWACWCTRGVLLSKVRNIIMLMCAALQRQNAVSVLVFTNCKVSRYCILPMHVSMAYRRLEAKGSYLTLVRVADRIL